jgi:hypothetical protein
MASTYLTRNTGGSGTSGTIATLSLWVKLSDITNFIGVFSASSNSTGSPFCLISRENTGEFRFSDYTNNTTVRAEKITSALARDVNGWYHIVIAIDTNQATASDRIKFYINGVLQTSFSTNTNYSLGATTSLGQNNEMVIGRYEPYNAGYWNGLVSHFHYTDGTAYDASTFGETDATTGIWKPKTQPSVTYGTNGFFLKFENSGSMGLDSSPNANNFTVNGTMTQTVDTPSNVFVTFNPLDTARTSSSTPLFQNGNTTAYNAASDGSYLASTMAVNKGKWYAEFKIGAGTNTRSLGILDVTSSSAYIGHPTSGSATNSYAYNSLSSGGLLKAGNTTIASSVGTTTDGDIVSVMIDLDSATKTIKFQKNGVDLSGTTQMTISQSSDTYWIFALRADSDQYVYANFGNGYFGTTAVSSATSDESGLGIFEYTVPSGYYALCTKNINTQG